jgi:hypothetical protein
VRPGRLLLPICGITCVCALAASASAAPVTSAPPGTFDGCPRGAEALLLAAGVYAPAIDLAVRRFLTGPYLQMARRHPGWSTKIRGARVLGVTLVRDWLPSGWIKSECGGSVWDRSVAAHTYFPQLDLPHNPVGRCNDCDHVTYLLSRTASGWTVWGSY